RKLIIAKEDMPSFTTNVLPILNKHLHIQTLCDFSLFAPPELKSIVYLDMPTSDKVTIRLRHQYGDKIHIGFAEKDTRQSFDLRGEVLIENIIYKYFSHPSVPGEMCIENDENALYELVENGVSEIAQHSEIFATDAFRDMRVKPPAIVSVGVKTEANLLRLHFDVQGVDMAELEEVLASYRMAKKYHRLRDGTFLSLEESSLSDFSELAQGLSLTSKEILSGEIQTPKYRALYLDALLKQSERMQYDRDSDFKKIVRDVRNVSDADYEVPQSLQPVLRNYQKTGYRWLRTIAAYGFGGILADDMGLGKTLQVLALLLAQKNEQSEKTISIVICPSSLILNWQSEADKFAGELHVECVTGTAPVREYIIKTSMETDLIITSYELLKRDIELYSEMNFKYVIADEAQYMKNQNTQNAKAVKTLNAEVRLALTGTPVENSLAEVWSVFDFLMPGYL
ncbi:MAG: SNF2 helicase associated domain-containing protein, partial [Oscillospiraceae bacterium]